jgi:hypothetical protein
VRTTLLVLLGLLLPTGLQASGLSSQLLTSSAWCSFSYNKTTGYSHTKRFAFFGDGTYAMGSGSEGYSSGSGGSMASQGQRGGAGYWRLEGGQLFMSEGRGQLQPVRAFVKRASNGITVINSEGLDYTACR